MHFRTEPCWFGKKKVVYVNIRLPGATKGAINFVIHGYPLKVVVREVKRALAEAFEWHGGPGSGARVRIGRNGRKGSPTQKH